MTKTLPELIKLRAKRANAPGYAQNLAAIDAEIARLEQQERSPTVTGPEYLKP